MSNPGIHPLPSFFVRSFFPNLCLNRDGVWLKSPPLLFYLFVRSGLRTARHRAAASRSEGQHGALTEMVPTPSPHRVEEHHGPLPEMDRTPSNRNPYLLFSSEAIHHPLPWARCPCWKTTPFLIYLSEAKALSTPYLILTPTRLPQNLEYRLRLQKRQADHATDQDIRLVLPSHNTCALSPHTQPT